MMYEVAMGVFLGGCALMVFVGLAMWQPPRMSADEAHARMWLRDYEGSRINRKKLRERGEREGWDDYDLRWFQDVPADTLWERIMDWWRQ
jgi:hypothetical protein